MVYLKKFTSGPCLDKPSDVQQYSVTHAHLRARALSPERNRHLITDAVKVSTS